MSTIFINSYRFGGGGWWTAGGASGAVAVYQPIGAASLVDSYTDLSGNGNDAAPGVAPAWDAVNGWIGNGSTSYLTTGVIPPNDQTWSAIIRYSNYVNPGPPVFPRLFGRSSITGRFLIGFNGDDTFINFGNGGILNISSIPEPVSGVLGFAGTVAYIDGIAQVGVISSAAGSGADSLFLLAQNNAGIDSEHIRANVQAIAIYNNTLPASQVAAVSAAMAAL